MPGGRGQAGRLSDPSCNGAGQTSHPRPAPPACQPASTTHPPTCSARWQDPLDAVGPQVHVPLLPIIISDIITPAGSVVAGHLPRVEGEVGGPVHTHAPAQGGAPRRRLACSMVEGRSELACGWVGGRV